MKDLPTDTKPEGKAGSETAPQDRIPFWKKMAYSCGMGTNMIGKQSSKQMAFPVYNIEFGVNPGWISLTLMLSRIWDAITDPVVGRFSDNARTKWGRRRPFIFIGAILAGIAFACLWLPPRGLSDLAYFIWFLVGLFFFFGCISVFAVPWNSLGFELTPDYNERTRLFSYGAYFNNVATLGSGWFYALAQLDYFDDTIQGIRVIGTAFGAIMIALGVLPAIFCKERFEKQVKTQKKVKLSQAFSHAFQNSPFLKLVGCVLFIYIGILTVGVLGNYVMIYYVYGGDKQLGAVLMGHAATWSTIATFVGIPVVSKLATTYGKRRVFVWCLWVAWIGTVAKWFCYTPSAPFLALIPSILLAPSTGATAFLIQSMIADVCDYDELKRGARREGSFGAVYSWSVKLGIAAAVGLSGFILVWIGYDSDLGSAQTESTLLWMRILFTFVPGIALLVSIYFISRFPITPERASEIRSELEARRGVV